MVKQTIRIFCRIKPSQRHAGIYDVDQEGDQGPSVCFTIPRDLADGFVNNKREVYRFRFDHIFDQKTKQDEIFEMVARPTIDSVLTGYNGTIFAYGQTGSGKTFTITGGAERYVDRGIIPRTLSYIFEQYEGQSNHVYTTHVSYLEIYNENGYDLLDPRHEASKLEDLPKVSLLEDSDGNIHLKNLSLHSAGNEEDALNLLFLGDTNRMIAETPMNQASTRSHCIFTIHVSARETGSATIRRSKLHLVDLAGSERIGKTGVGGVLLNEAKYINLSLHFLEQVIISLSEKARSHIPYRNSMMTSVLRDSLGGNCMTSMVATCSVDKKNLDESISTCRFAQRVAMIKNDALLNEEVDPKLMIARLKREIQELKNELALATGQEYDGEIDDEERNRLRRLVRSYIDDNDKEAALQVGADMRKINFCFGVLKEFVLSGGGISSDSIRSEESKDLSPIIDEDSSYLAEKNEVSKLKDLIKQRDNEINILVSMLKKEKQHTKDADNRLAQLERIRGTEAKSVGELSSQTARDGIDDIGHVDSSQSDIPRSRPASGRKSRNALLDGLNKQRKDMSAGRQEAFDIFKRDYADNKIIEENKRLLKQKYAEAKTLGEQVNKSRKTINSVKAKLEENRTKRSIQANVAGSTDDLGHLDDAEGDLREALDEEKARYRNAFTQLKNLKTEIEHLQHLLEKSKVKLQRDFELWWTEQTNNVAEEKVNTERVKTAWKTPPTSPADLENIRQRSTDDARISKKLNESPSTRTSVTSSVASDRSNLSQVRMALTNEGVSQTQHTKDYKTSNRHMDKGPPTGRIATKLRTEVRSASDIVSRSSHDTSSSPESRNPETLEERWKSTNAAVGQGSLGTQPFRLTGDTQADADILAFMHARQSLLRQKNSSKR